MTDKLTELLEDVQTVYEGKRMVVHPNSFDRLRMEVRKLEKENAELRNNGFTVSAMTEQQLKVALEKGERLEKENAELKEQNRNYEQLIDNGSVTLAKERLKNYKQLTKAKEIIKKLYTKQDDYCVDCTCYNFLENMRAEAEQFLKEIEK